MTTPLYIKELQGKGRAVFAGVDIPEGGIIETSPLLVVPDSDTPNLTATALIDYFFFFDKEKNELALSLGYGSLYNHAVHPNARYELDRDERILRYYALKNISKDEEITINYSGEPGDPFEQWFASRGIVVQ